jgi:hypothetical protein
MASVQVPGLRFHFRIIECNFVFFRSSAHDRMASGEMRHKFNIGTVSITAPGTACAPGLDWPFRRRPTAEDPASGVLSATSEIR